MSTRRRSIPVIIGLFIYAVTQLAERLTDIPPALHIALMITSLISMLIGVISVARSSAMKNSKLRRWKLRLIGRKIRE